MANDDLIFADIEMVMPADESADASHAIPAARAMKLPAQQRMDEKLRLSCRMKETGKLLFITTYVIE